MPEQILEKLKTSLRPQWISCLIGAWSAGLLAHFYKLVNWLPNWDSLVFREDPQNMTHLGRWFLSAVCGITSEYDLPWLNALVCLLCVGFGALVICRIFRLEGRLPCFLLGALTAVFPTVTSTLTYGYVADAYGLAFLMAALAAMYLLRGGRWLIPGTVLITLSCGIYQAYLTVTVMLILCRILADLLLEDIPFGQLMTTAGRCLLAGAAGAAAYVGILVVMLRMGNTVMSGYLSFSDSGSLGIGSLVTSYIQSVYRMKTFFWGYPTRWNLYTLLNTAVFAVTGLLMLWQLLSRKRFLPWYRGCLIPVCAGIFPLGAALLLVLNPYMDYHGLMTMGYLSVYILFLLCYEQIRLPGKAEAVKKWIILAVCTGLIWTLSVTANAAYHKLQLAYEKSFGTLIRIADRIEQLPDSGKTDRILVLGALDGSEAYSVDFPPLITGVTDSYILRRDDPLVNQSVLTSALNDYCGKDYRFLSGQEYDRLADSQAVKAMPLWPESGSVAVVENTVIIKLDNAYE